MTRRTMNLLRSFARAETGAVVAEAVIVLPLFLWAYLGLFVYWDAFRSTNTVQKAAFTISDMLSRSQAGIDTEFVDGTRELAEYLIDEDQDARMRISSVMVNAETGKFQLHWSASPDNTMPPLTEETLQLRAGDIPNMAVGDFVVIVELEVDYRPAFDIGLAGLSRALEDQVFRQFVVTRPRFLPCLPLNEIACPAT